MPKTLTTRHRVCRWPRVALVRDDTCRRAVVVESRPNEVETNPGQISSSGSTVRSHILPGGLDVGGIDNAFHQQLTKITQGWLLESAATVRPGRDNEPVVCGPTQSERSRSACSQGFLVASSPMAPPCSSLFGPSRLGWMPGNSTTTSADSCLAPSISR